VLRKAIIKNNVSVKVWIAALALTMTSIVANATPFGLSLSVPLVTKDPKPFHGYRVALTYQPPAFVWHYASVYFDASYGNWWTGDQGPYHSISIYGIAPYLRLYFTKTEKFSPYVEASLGASYLSKTRIGCRNLGIHYSFQDQLTLGTAFGKDQPFFISLSAVHYSNGSMASSNAGITMPLVLSMGYRF